MDSPIEDTPNAGVCQEDVYSRRLQKRRSSVQSKTSGPVEAAPTAKPWHSNFSQAGRELLGLDPVSVPTRTGRPVAWGRSGSPGCPSMFPAMTGGIQAPSIKIESASSTIAMWNRR